MKIYIREFKIIRKSLFNNKLNLTKEDNVYVI